MVDIVRGRVDFETTLQTIDGFGCCLAFQRAAVLRGKYDLSAGCGEEIANLLFDSGCGAGFSILRLGIGSSSSDEFDLMKSIQPEDPGGPDAEPKYCWDGDDSGQVWLAKHAQKHGVRRFYASAWSAPGYMKNNGSDVDGGVLLGLPGTDREGPDWRNAYAEYLIQYMKFYREEGISISDLGFVNEPELARYYASMQLSCAQIIDLVKILGPKLAQSGLDVNLVCCESLGWQHQADFTTTIESDPEAAGWVGIHSGHQYGWKYPECLARSPLPTSRPVWMSEWMPQIHDPVWNETWDQGEANGMMVAENISDALTMANVSAYLYWSGASHGDTTGALIRTYHDDYVVSKRFWAIAAYSRFIRPGAVRCAAGSECDTLKISAYENPDASRVIEIINTGTTAVGVDLSIGPSVRTPATTSYVTDEVHALEPVAAAVARDGGLAVQLAARSLTTVVIGPADHAGIAGSTIAVARSPS